jgi:hypothetical protein
MKLSIIMPSHNTGARIYSNILNACSMGTEDVEIIIRDNSGDAEKRAFLSRIKEPYCRIVSADECPGQENLKALIHQAEGEFVSVICDDDFMNGYALPSILPELEKIKGNPDIIGTTGIFIVDSTTNSCFDPFNQFDHPAALQRVRAHLDKGNNIFQFSPIRLSVSKDVLGFSLTLPIYLSYHDWLTSCLLLMHGRITFLRRYFYQYYNSNWATYESGLRTDERYFRLAGLDTSNIRIQWLIAGMEGAQAMMSKYQRVQLPPNERQELASCWFENMFKRFRETALIPERQPVDAQFDPQAVQLAQKWLEKKEIHMTEILTDIVEHFSLSSPEIAQRYYDFWK